MIVQNPKIFKVLVNKSFSGFVKFPIIAPFTLDSRVSATPQRNLLRSSLELMPSVRFKCLEDRSMELVLLNRLHYRETRFSCIELLDNLF
jgi:hypothetical protein